MAAPVLAQFAQGTGTALGAAQTATASLAVSPTPGNLLIFIVIIGNGGPPTAPTTVPAGLTLETLFDFTPQTDGTLAVYSRSVVAGDGTSWTFAWNSGSASGMFVGVMEWTAAIWDTIAASAPANTNPTDAPTITTGLDNETVVSLLWSNQLNSMPGMPADLASIWDNYQFGFNGSFGGTISLGYVTQTTAGVSATQAFPLTGGNIQIGACFGMSTTGGALISAPTFVPTRISVPYRRHKSASLGLLTTPVPPPTPVRFRPFINVNL